MERIARAFLRDSGSDSKPRETDTDELEVLAESADPCADIQIGVGLGGGEPVRRIRPNDQVGQHQQVLLTKAACISRDSVASTGPRTSWSLGSVFRG